MKLNTFLLSVLIGALMLPAGRGYASDIREGDSLSRVLDVLGDPSLRMDLKDGIWLRYDRGTVKLADGRVVEADLMTPEELAAAKAEQARRDARDRAARAALREQLFREGTGLKAARITDPAFLALPASRQAAFWKEFQSRYPDVPVYTEYTDALARAELEHLQRLETERIRREEQRMAMEEQRLRRQIEQQDEIRRLEDRVVRAEWRADRYRCRLYGQQRYSAPVVIVHGSGHDRAESRPSVPAYERFRSQGDTSRMIRPVNGGLQLAVSLGN